MNIEPLTLIVKANVVFLLFCAVYWLVLRRTTFFSANRLWLLVAPFVAWSIPQFEVTSVFQDTGLLFTMPELIIEQGQVPGSLGSFDLVEALLFVHWGGCLVAFALLLGRYWQAWRMTRNWNVEAFSLFGAIRIPTDLNREDVAPIYMHEAFHVRHGHSWDILFYEIFSALSWWNPIWRWAIRELKLVHEFQADEAVNEVTSDYDALLIANAMGVPTNSLTNSFRSLTLKTRINMLHRERSPRKALTRYALIIPLVFVALMTISWSAPGATDQEPTKGKIDKMPAFKGGQEALFSYIAEELNYPKEASKLGLEGKALIEFVVRSDGRVDKARIKESTDPSLGAEALRVIRSMPNWEPGMNEGKAVDASMVLPIVFKLGD
jgi:TonB family protein